jgi:hypothetical protein
MTDAELRFELEGSYVPASGSLHAVLTPQLLVEVGPGEMKFSPMFHCHCSSHLQPCSYSVLCLSVWPITGTCCVRAPLCSMRGALPSPASPGEASVPHTGPAVRARVRRTRAFRAEGPSLPPPLTQVEVDERDAAAELPQLASAPGRSTAGSAGAAGHVHAGQSEEHAAAGVAGGGSASYRQVV